MPKKKATPPPPPPPGIEPLVTNVRGAGVMLTLGKDRIYHLINTKQLDSYLDGDARRITTASIKAYAARKAAEPFQRARYPKRERDGRAA
jgi:hypothetical protein